jgi:hypothetical protein
MKNVELMRAAGSRDGASDPESPTQIAYMLDHGSPEERFLAWVKMHTIRMSRSPFCVDEHGKPIYMERAAADLGWNLRNTRNVASRVASQGRCRVENKRIWYRADVPERRREGEQPSFVQNGWSPYLAEIIAKLPADKRAILEATKPKFVRWRDGLLADGMAQMRIIVERVEDNMLAGVGVKRKRYTKSREPKNGQLRLELFAEPDFVQNGAGHSVQNAKSILYNAENGIVQNGPSLLTTDADTYSKSVGRSVVEAKTEKDRPTDKAALSDRKNAIRKLLLEVAASTLPGETPSAALCARVAASLGDAPLSFLNTRLQAAISRGKLRSMGLAVSLAAEAESGWKQGEIQRAEVARRREAEETIPDDERDRLLGEVEEAMAAGGGM